MNITTKKLAQWLVFDLLIIGMVVAAFLLAGCSPTATPASGPAPTAVAPAVPVQMAQAGPVEWGQAQPADGTTLTLSAPVRAANLVTFTVTITNHVPALVTGVSFASLYADGLSVNVIAPDDYNLNPGNNVGVTDGQTLTYKVSFSTVPQDARNLSAILYVNHGNSNPATDRPAWTGVL
jgi:hypothetical protein